jgi:hypothetical protein
MLWNMLWHSRNLLNQALIENNLINKLANGSREKVN